MRRENFIGTSIRMEIEDHKKIKELARNDKRSMASYLEIIIMEHLAKIYQKEKQGVKE